MPALRLQKFKEVLITSNPKQVQMYKEVLSFDGCYAFASADELTVQRKDGSVFRTAITHYESDYLTETYVGHFPNGEAFRFIFASNSNPMAQIDPMVSFGSMSSSGWAVHFKVRP